MTETLLHDLIMTTEHLHQTRSTTEHLEHHRRHLIVTLARDGFPISGLAVAAGVSRQRVYQIIQEGTA